MNNTDKLKTKKCYIVLFLNYIKQSSIILFFLLSTQMYAQQETKPRDLSIQAGVNSGILGGGYGPSFSINYAFRIKKLPIEVMLFYDRQKGSGGFFGGSQNQGIGVAAGLRMNLFSKKNRVTSFTTMVGFMYSSAKYNHDRTLQSVFPCLSLGISNIYYQKHMISVGLNYGEFIVSLFAKYGFWF